VGYSSVYFLSHFPGCRVIAVEPDGDNFASLQKNLAPYGDRAQALKRGIWSKSAELAIEDVTYRDGRDWTRQVRECEDGEAGDIRAVTVAELLLQSGRNKLSLLKIDIEGAEAVVFADPSCQQWLIKTEAIAIELHDDSGFGPASDLFHAAIQDQGYQISHSGELTICLRPDQTGG
jgi:FkbM family methyltransferase